jgi:hypothetical protein
MVFVKAMGTDASKRRRKPSFCGEDTREVEKS